MFPHVPFQTCVNNITHRVPPWEPASPKGQRANALVTRKWGRNCSTFASHIPVCLRRNTLSSGPKSPAAPCGCTHVNECSCSSSPSFWGGWAGWGAFHNNVAYSCAHVLKLKMAPDAESPRSNILHSLCCYVKNKKGKKYPLEDNCIWHREENRCAKTRAKITNSLTNTVLHVFLSEWRSPRSARLLSGSSTSPPYRNGFFSWWVNPFIFSCSKLISVKCAKGLFFFSLSSLSPYLLQPTILEATSVRSQT